MEFLVENTSLLMTMGDNHIDTSSYQNYIMHIGLATVNRDISYLKSGQGQHHETNYYEDINSGKLNENIAPLPSLLFSAHILPP